MTSKLYKRYVLGMLTLVVTMNFVDRGLMTLLLQPIKEDLHLSDAQLGVLTGVAFGLFYVTLGLPIARWADRGNRVTITSISIGLWGATVMACLFVLNFTQFMFARIGAAVGESGCMPPTYSLVGDYFPEPAERTRAMAIYWLCGPLSELLSFTVGSWLYHQYGWRLTFLLMGIPALLIAGVFKLTIREPRTVASHMKVVPQQTPRFSDVLHLLWHQRASRHLCIASILTITLSLGLAPWYGAFMIRSHGIGVDQLGVWLGLIFGIGGFVGIYIGGYVSSGWFAANERSQLRFSSIMTAALAPCLALFLLLPQQQQALIALVPLIVVWYVFIGPTFALLQRLVAEDMRATTLSVVMLLANLIGMGVATEVVGIVSDKLQPLVGSDSLRYAMLIMSSLALWAAYHFWQAGKTVSEDLVRAEGRVRTIAADRYKRIELPIG